MILDLRDTNLNLYAAQILRLSISVFNCGYAVTFKLKSKLFTEWVSAPTEM